MTLTIGPLRAKPGQKTRGSLPADLGTTTVEVPLDPRQRIPTRPPGRDRRRASTEASSSGPTPPPAWPDCWNRTRSPARW